MIFKFFITQNCLRLQFIAGHIRQMASSPKETAGTRLWWDTGSNW